MLGFMQHAVNKQGAIKMRKETIEIEAADIPTMAQMPLSEYKNYIETSLIFADPHGVIRATQGEYPLACNKAQLAALIEYLHGKNDSLES